MGVKEVRYCDDHRCDARIEIDQGDDGVPEGWELNIDNDAFCPKHARLLGPYDPELDEASG